MKNTLTAALKGDRELVVTRTFNAPRALVFEAHTRADLVRKWLTGPPGWTMPVCEIDLRVGGRFRYVWQNESGERMGMGGTYRDIVAPARVVTTELFDIDWTGGETINTLELSEAGGRTTTTLTILYASAADREAAMKTGMTTGMEMSYAQLDTLLADG
jgi:uncharacterized protein YndB with AHSA1/START domain